jgi:hypothetical protein
VQKLMPCKLLKAKWCNDFFLPQSFPFCENFTFKLGNLCFPTKTLNLVPYSSVDRRLGGGSVQQRRRRR